MNIVSMSSKSSSPKLTYQGTLWEPRYSGRKYSVRKNSRSNRPVANIRGKRTSQANPLTNTKRVRLDRIDRNLKKLVRENYFPNPSKSSNVKITRENYFFNPIAVNELVRQIVKMSLNNKSVQSRYNRKK